MTPSFLYKFNIKVVKDPNRDYLMDFKHRFDYSNCDRLKVINRRTIVIHNDFIRIKINWNIWHGIGHAKLYILEMENDHILSIDYSLDYTYFVWGVFIGLVIIFIFFGLYMMEFNELMDLLFPILFMLIALPLNLLIVFLRHRSLFRNTALYGYDMLGNYDWNSILKQKTEDELVNIVQGKRVLPKQVEELAKKELERRVQH